MVCFIHREEYYDRENEDIKGQAEIIIAKQRNGPTGTVKLAYMSDYTRFENLDTSHGGGRWRGVLKACPAGRAPCAAAVTS